MYLIKQSKTGIFSLVKCCYCMQVFPSEFNLNQHLKTHSKENYHMCPYEGCDKRYAHESKLKAHIRSHHEKASNLKLLILVSAPIRSENYEVGIGCLVIDFEFTLVHFNSNSISKKIVPCALTAYVFSPET